ncbi:GspH/FimT family pseudopilin [uncultured Microbulbifer sp.]|uniref:GspH/FimT family pseudopilin n=1 Tax=uncultured Microbulbifer sp. TaxID=348147 RepID=UPI002605E2A3|nr:GspH/FimT family pseudopilin [uncultured Microbulbifer sp.]
MKRIAGFTLIELMLGLTILTIVTILALPSFTDFVKRYKNKAKQFELFEILILMRSKAYSENRSYSLCPSQETSCANNWSGGALLFTDDDRDGTLDTGEKVERLFAPLEDGATLSWNAFNNKGYLIFNPGGTTPSQSGNFSYCPASGEAKYGWIIILNAIGRPYFAKDKDGDGIVENGSGKKLICPQT